MSLTGHEKGEKDLLEVYDPHKEFGDVNKKFDPNETLEKAAEVVDGEKALTAEELELIDEKNIDWEDYDNLSRIVYLMRNHISYANDFETAASAMALSLRQNPDYMKYKVYHILSASSDFSDVDENLNDFEGELSVINFLKNQLKAFKQKNNIN